MSTKLIGTAPDQVPTNADLGSMAFQDRESVTFLDGRGGLNHLDVTNISAQIGVSAVDIFVYDTSKDSDGGAWRNRCQHTSWYNESLNTPTRGSRREFPSVAVIVIVSNYVTIYDGDDPTLPMWMGFPDSSYASQAWENIANCAYALNGKVAVGCNPYDLYVIDFIADKSVSYSTGSDISGTHKNPISGRAPSTGSYSQPSQIWYFGTVPNIISRYISDVAMTVLPGAPIDVSTGLPIPTIAVSTPSGVSVIKDNGLVVNLVNENPSYVLTGRLQFNRKNQLQFVMDASQRYLRTFNIPNSGVSVSQWGSIYDDGITVGLDIPSFTENAININAIAENAIGTPYGLETFEESSANPTYSLFSNITSKYNTGWMVGNGVRGTWLSDTTQEVAVGTELITNGTFDSNLNGWTYTDQDQNMTISNVSGKIRLVRNDSTGTQANPKQTISTIPGRAYVLTYNVTLNISAANNSIVIVSDSVTGQIRDYRPTGSGNQTLTFTATGTQTQILLAVDTNNDSVDFDNISVRLGEVDRSIINRGLQIYGTINKAPVAAGADLVAYSNFTTSNYLYQPYNSQLDFGTGDFCISAWVKTSVNGTYQVIYSRAYYNGTIETSLAGLTISPSGSPYLEVRDSAANGSNTSTSATVLPTDTWVHVLGARRSGILFMYVNGVLISTAPGNRDVSSTSALLRVGCPTSGAGVCLAGSMALLKVSRTVPSDTQILKIYNDEKYLFQENSKATLYGTNDGISALAYDIDTQLLHVGTSSGRSVFDGLRRVDNTTTAVTSTISAAGGLVAEN